MKVSPSFLPLQLIFLSVLTLGISHIAQAQDTIVTKDGRSQSVKIVGATTSTVQVQVGSNVIPVPLANIAQIVMAPPAEYTNGVAAYQAKDYVKAVVAIKGVAEKYKGLPTEWARSATALVGDIFLAINDPVKAEAAYKEFQRVYPGVGAITAEVGMARIALMKKDYQTAKQSLEPIAANALKDKNPKKELVAAYGQIFLVLGQVKEAEGDLSGALEDYLRTTTLFASDSLIASAAQEKADALRKQKSVTVP